MTCAQAARTDSEGRRVGHDQPGAGVGDHPGQLVGGRPRIDGYGDDLRPQDTEVARDELEPVADHEHHPGAGRDPEGAQAGGERRHLLLELQPGAAATARLDHCQSRRRLLRRTEHEVGEIGRQHGPILPHVLRLRAGLRGYADRRDAA
ncbi:hypothetical protein LP418_08405 [Nocardioides sp. B-3]|nr:hypothetical protein [Nocardioides sp. B-3]UUZ60771.1 hypothetical protein LP418_08405 [Nocardioides sp. B-3]